MLMTGDPIVWCSKKQPVVDWSTAEAEYRGLANVVCDVMCVESLLTEIGVTLTSPLPPSHTIWCENTSVISIASIPIQHAKMKHDELDLFFIRKMVSQGSILVNYVPTHEYITNILTKTLTERTFMPLKQTSGVSSLLEAPTNNSKIHQASTSALAFSAVTDNLSPERVKDLVYSSLHTVEKLKPVLSYTRFAVKVCAQSSINRFHISHHSTMDNQYSNENLWMVLSYVYSFSTYLRWLWYIFSYKGHS